MKTYYISTSAQRNKKLSNLQELDIHDSGLMNLETMVKVNATIQSSIATDSSNYTHEQLEQLSIDLGHTIYYLPQNTTLIFDEKGRLIEAQGENSKEVWQFVDGWPMPYECFMNGFPFPIKMEEIWKADKEAETISVEDLKWNLDYTWFWSNDDKPYSVRPIDVLNGIESYPEHKERVEKAELKYPLTLVQTKQNRWLIYDGVHRYLKALLNNANFVQVQRFTIEEMEEFVRENSLKSFQEYKELKY